MIGADTNVLVRLLTQDDLSQARRVDAILSAASRANENIYIDDVVLCEVIWVLEVRYKYEKTAIVNVLDQLLDTALFEFEDRGFVRNALIAYRAGPADFADYLIGLRNIRAGCDHTVTFDRTLQAHDAFTLL